MRGSYHEENKLLISFAITVAMTIVRGTKVGHDHSATSCPECDALVRCQGQVFLVQN